MGQKGFRVYFQLFTDFLLKPVANHLSVLLFLVFLSMCTFCRAAIGSNTVHTQDQKKHSELIPLYKPLNLPTGRPEAQLYTPCVTCCFQEVIQSMT